MKRKFLVLGSACLWAALVHAQVTVIDNDFETDDPCIDLGWLCGGNAKWIDPALAPCFDPANPVNPADWFSCNLYDPPEGYVLLAAAAPGQRGSLVRTERVYYDSFRLTAEVEMRNNDGACGAPADGMSIFIKGGTTTPVVVSGGGELGVCFGDGQPLMYFGFDNWSNGGANANGGNDFNDANHVEFGYSPTGWANVDPPPMDMSKGAWKHLSLPLNNGQINTPNRFQIEVQVKAGIVTCDIGNKDAGMAKTRMYTYTIPDFEPFEGYLGMAASTGSCDQNHLLHSIKIEDLTGVCIFPPATATRDIVDESTGSSAGTFNPGDTMDVSITLTDLRQVSPDDPDCDVPTEITVVEKVPLGWTPENVSDGGSVAGETITWVLSGASLNFPKTLSYKTDAVTGGTVVFGGTYQQTNKPGQAIYGIEGDFTLIPPVNDFGFIAEWLLLGPYQQTAYDTPGLINLERDYLTDGTTIDEFSVMPKAGDTVNTDFNVSGSLAYQNPVFTTPTWEAQTTLGSADRDLINMNAIWASDAVPDPNAMMGYAVVYVENPSGSPLSTWVQAASDDSLAIYIGRCPVLLHSVPRGQPGTNMIQDTIPDGNIIPGPTIWQADTVTLEPGWNRVMVKVFEGGGDWNFRLRFADLTDPLNPIYLGPPTIKFSYDPAGKSLPDTGCPVAIISSPALLGIAPFDVHLSGERSIVQIGRTIASYDWTWSDGPTASGKDIVRTLDTPGTYTVTLTVTDSNGGTSLLAASRDVHVFEGGIIVQGDDLDALALTSAAQVLTLKDGVKAYYSRPGDDVAAADQSLADMTLEVTSVPAGEEEFPVAILVRNQGDHDSAISFQQTTSGVTSKIGFDVFTGGAPTANAADGTTPTPRVDLAIGTAQLMAMDSLVADAYMPFAYLESVTAMLKVVQGKNVIRLTNAVPADGTGRTGNDNGNAVAGIVIGPHSPDLRGRVVACPMVPTGLKAVGLTCPEIQLTWTANKSPVAGYNVYRSLVQTGPFDNIASLVSTSEYVDRGLTAGTRYYYKVSAVGVGADACESSLSIVRNATAGTGVCQEAPTNLRVTDNKEKIALAWDRVADVSCQGYNVYRSPTAVGTYAKLTTTPLGSGESTYTDTAVTVGEDYFYRVRAVYAGGVESADSNTATATVETGGTEPRFRRGDANSDGAVDLSDPVNVLGYLFLGSPKALACFDAADADDSGELDITDAVYSLNWQFLGGKDIPLPGPFNCGEDPTNTDLLPKCEYPCP